MSPASPIAALLPTRPFMFDIADIFSCAQHEELKLVANKLFHRSCEQGNKVTALVAAHDFDAGRFNGAMDKLDKIDTELANIIRGLKRCSGCAHYWLRIAA